MHVCVQLETDNPDGTIDTAGLTATISYVLVNQLKTIPGVVNVVIEQISSDHPH